MTVISIHALLAESDCRDGKAHVGNSLFLSTLSLRRATESTVDEVPTNEISIHALLAESDVGDVWACRWPDISIHALLAESDAIVGVLSRAHKKFLSTLSLRRAT